MTLFGRDALITAYMALPVDRDMALGVLEVLAELQGVGTDSTTEEEPGRIVHETRQLGLDGISLTRHGLYYGSADATPLFVVLLGELLRWGIDPDRLRGLVPHADRALQWVTDFGDRDGDGYVEYLRSSDLGLVNQGWKDSVDGIRYRDGRVAEAPLALCEVQGYVYAAWLARADIADHLGDGATAERCRVAAAELKVRFNRDFWIEELGTFAMALGPQKEHVDSIASNVGHCLWSGIVDEEHAPAVAETLMSAPMWTGWGIRTLAADDPGFDPMSYHCGTVWPHDGAICAMGLARYGLHREALTVSDGLFAASEAWHGRLPEFFCGLDRRDIATPSSTRMS
jgi:glycogen debranching enzyme